MGLFGPLKIFYSLYMFIKKTKKENGATHISIVESIRVGDKVKHKTIRSLGQHKDEREIAIIEKAAQLLLSELENTRAPVLPIFDPYDFYTVRTAAREATTEDKVNFLDTTKEQKINTGIVDVFGSQYDQMNFFEAIKNSRKDEQWNKILKSCVLSRIANPCSKRKTSKELRLDFDVDVPLEKIYRMMDQLSKNEKRIKNNILQQTKTLLDNQVDVMFFDVTTLYFESFEPDELRNFGFSKDCKFKETQIVLALITTTEGLPISYELFPGNMSEGKTLIEMIKALKGNYDLHQVFLVADRAMFTEANLSMMDEEGVQYVVACKLKSQKQELKEEILKKDWIGSINNEGTASFEFEQHERRLIVEYSTKRAKKDAQDRQRLIERLLKKVKNGKIKVSALINNHGTKKYVKISSGNAEIDRDKIASDERWDGLHGVITNVKGKTSEELLGRYRGLWQIEAAFRMNKNDLKMRPIYHWKKERIKAHILICFIAYTIISHTQFRLKQAQVKMSFEELRDELLRTDSVIIREKSTGMRFCVPSEMNVGQTEVYKVLKITRLKKVLILN